MNLQPKRAITAVLPLVLGANLWAFAIPIAHAQATGTTKPMETSQTTSPASPSPQEARAAMQAANHEAHQRFLALLKIPALRPGASAKHDSPDYANYDEAKAGPFSPLPDPLLLKNGKPVTTANEWQTKRSKEIREDFDREVYGRVPKKIPPVRWEVTSTTHETVGDVPVVVKHLSGIVDNREFPGVSVVISLTLTTPANASGPVPVVMQLAFTLPPGVRPGGANGSAAPVGPTWQEQVLHKGWGYAVYSPTSVQPDNGAGLTQGIIGLVNKGQPRKPDEWGALRAWAWGASRALDYFETDKNVDAHRVAIEGHSRYGKAALVTMAYDARFAVAYVSSSGAGGAALWRRNFGEKLENVAGENEYHWMAGNFVKYAGPLHPANLPIDSHELIALCAPRPVFLGAGVVSGDGWVDGRGSFIAAVHAGPVYRLLGGKDLGTTEFPPLETGLTTGDLAFRQHNGGHTDVPNWPTFLTFASRYMPSSGTSSGAAVAAVAAPVDAASVVIPPPVREFRGVWAASVENIDWPSRPDLTPDQQRAELLLLLDRAKQLNLNAVLLQVRPACDALYQSDLEPWSEYLTGQMGKAPEPFYDPLTFAVDEAHKRGLELHAWFNPFRARAGGANDKRPASPNHISRTHPDWVRNYGNLQWLDPGVKEARDYSVAVVLDVVKRYDIDGIHIDDYFYPYKVNGPDGKELDFPDDAPWSAYQAGGGKLTRDDWRRSNIDDYVERMYTQTKAAKPWVKVGISPFGIWRPGNPAQIKGFDSYAQLYGDSRKWLHEGWADYFTPQLYWPIAQTPQSFPVLLNWWAGENGLNRHLWPGLYTSQADGTRARWPQAEVEYQIKTTRGQAGATGDIHFSAKFLLHGDTAEPGSLSRYLSETVYAQPVLVPASPWLAAPNAPLPAAPGGLEATPSATAVSQAGWTVRWQGAAQPAPAQWVVQWATTGGRGGALLWNQVVVPGGERTAFIPAPTTTGAESPFVVAVSAVNRVGILSLPQRVALPTLP